MNTNILGISEISYNKAAAWAESRGAKTTGVLLAPLFWEIAPRLGVRPEVAYAQSMKETGFFRFGGVIDETYHNTCGLKNTSGGGNYDPNAHWKADDWNIGILGHVEHLALYADATPDHLGSTATDPRHFAWIKGKAKTIEALSNNWAGSGYGESLRDNYFIPLMNYKF